jgi:hypothetical protein
MWFVEHLARDIVKVNDKWFIVDTCKTYDAGWETGIASVDLERMKAEWDDIFSEFGEELDEEWGDEYIREHAELYTEWWDVQNYRTKRQAETGHKRVCKNGRLDEDE